MVSSAGLEPTAYGLGNRRSIQLSYEDIMPLYSRFIFLKQVFLPINPDYNLR